MTVGDALVSHPTAVREHEISVIPKPVQLHLEKVCDRNVALTTRLVDMVTTPLRVKLMKTGKLRPSGLVTPRFGLDDIMQAYDSFADAARLCAQRHPDGSRG